VGSAAHTAFLAQLLGQSRIDWHSMLSDYTAVESAVVRFALPAQSKIETGGGESFRESLM
jgi:hypothetical protein